MGRAWLIRAGEGAVELDAMRHANIIAVRYRSVGDAAAWSAAQIEQALRDDGRVAAASQLRARIQAFANEVGVGDLVVTPNTADREVWFARVTGPYRHSQHPPVEGYFHWREVQWLGAINRDTALPHDRLSDIDQQPTIYELRDADYWCDVASATPITNGADAITARAVRRTATVASKHPKPRVPCAGGCGLTWEPTSLVYGLCPDCRS
jgi:predicted Mrr-cat superfamily restriction endonuclease